MSASGTQPGLLAGGLLLRCVDEVGLLHRWDRVSLQRLLTKLVTAPMLLTPAPSVKGLSPLARALASMPDPEKEEKGVHPQHVCIQLDRESKSILGRASPRLLSYVPKPLRAADSA